MDEKTQEAIEKIADGSLAAGIKKNMKYSTTGIAVGAIVGIVIATFMGKSRIVYGVVGAIGGGVLGRVCAK